MSGGFPPRRVTLVLCTRDGLVLGALAPFDVPVPWWQEVGDVVQVAREVHGVDVTALRLLGPAIGPPAGGDVTYLAEVSSSTAGLSLSDWPNDVTNDRRNRLPYARPGGPAADLAWADEALAGQGTPRTGAARQVRTWNLSSIWRLPVDRSTAWLKVVPPFFAHEGRMLQLLYPGPVPRLVATEGPRMLLHHLDGDDLYGAPVEMLLPAVDALVRLQMSWAGRTGELLDLGLPDWRGLSLADLAADALRRTDGIAADTREQVTGILDGLPDRFARIADCGVPDTLVHGDFHSGNVRGTRHRLTILDWGDCGVGNPLLDVAAFTENRPPEDQTLARRAFASAWREVVPGCDAERAMVLLAPVAALRQAVTYRGFLDRIEPDEHVYHRDDPATWLRRAAELATQPSSR